MKDFHLAYDLWVTDIQFEVDNVVKEKELRTLDEMRYGSSQWWYSYEIPFTFNLCGRAHRATLRCQYYGACMVEDLPTEDTLTCELLVDGFVVSNIFYLRKPKRATTNTIIRSLDDEFNAESVEHALEEVLTEGEYLNLLIHGLVA